MTPRHVKTPLRERFYAKVDRSGDSDDCWQWAGMIDKAGYGRIRDGNGRAGGSAYAHRVSYELHVGPIPDELQIDHLCRNRWCVNPRHLEAVTAQENLLRGEAARVLLTGRCDRGHDQSVHGYFGPDGKRGRCRECRRQKALGIAEITERDHQKAILDLLRILGWRVAHFRPAQTIKGWRTPVAADGEGFPDLVAARNRLIFAELKREKTNPAEAQVEWLDGLAKAGSEVYLWRPSDLDEIARVLSKRWRYLPRGYRSDGVVTADAPLLVSDSERWTPASIWVEGGRFDEVGREAEIPGQTTIQDFVA